MQLLRATLLLSIFVILAAVNSPLALAAQSTGQGGIAGVLTGTVTDGTGAVVVGAHVTVRNAAGASLSVLTDGNGKFRFTALRSGPHVVVVKQQGFTDNTTENVNVSAGETSDISVVLQPLSAQTSVTVLSDRVDQIETVTSAVSSTLNEKEVLSFPTNGRNLLSFVSLSAGVSNQTGQDEIKVGVVGSAKFAVNGGRTEYNSFLVDGNDVLNTDISASHGESTLLVYPSIDAIKELKVMTSNYGAEYGRSASGTVLVSLNPAQTACMAARMNSFAMNSSMHETTSTTILRLHCTVATISAVASADHCLFRTYSIQGKTKASSSSLKRSARNKVQNNLARVYQAMQSAATTPTPAATEQWPISAMSAPRPIQMPSTRSNTRIVRRTEAGVSREIKSPSAQQPTLSCKLA